MSVKLCSSKAGRGSGAFTAIKPFWLWDKLKSSFPRVKMGLLSWTEKTLRKCWVPPSRGTVAGVSATFHTRTSEGKVNNIWDESLISFDECAYLVPLPMALHTHCLDEKNMLG